MSKKIYFASDFHLGADALETTDVREKKIVNWLSSVQHDMKALYLVGDVFDHWFEYKKVVPKGYFRLFGKLAELRDAQIPIYFFTGNHDMWMFRYFEEYFGIPIYRQPVVHTIDGKKFFIGHGDGLGPGDHGYKFIKRVFDNKVCQWLFRWLHPDLGIWLMQFFSAKSRQYTGDEAPFSDPNKEWLVQFAEDQEQVESHDFYIFGHRHLPIDYTLSNGKSRYINLGEWMYASSYGVWDGHSFELKFYESSLTKIYGNGK
ncbi:MAG: UDP-2,3-diacylglucosamine diphosphatase [Saprospiraceae bacterium]|nr:UDP-2,3-diacylglucosamine diphosphatase [Saprospiraceae bacterium]MBK8885241.1 UDP-2,3-diacylglucosamine diphosphatase [Saprospiraceae bacterium]